MEICGDVNSTKIKKNHYQAQGVIEIKILNHRPVLEILQKTIDTTT